jgi:hypothetical protein
MNNESDTQNEGFYFVVTPRVATLLYRNHAPTSYDSCRTRNCNKLITVCLALKLLFAVNGVYSSINWYE